MDATRRQPHCATKQLVIIFTSVSHLGPSPQKQLLSKASLVVYGSLSLQLTQY